MRRFFYDNEKIIRVVSIRLLDVPKWGKRVMVTFLKDFGDGDGPMEITTGYTQDEWVYAERELMEMHVPGVETDLFATE